MGTWGLGDMVQKTYTPLGLDMGTWGLGDMGFTGHGTEDIRTEHKSNMTRMKVSEDASSVRRCNLDMNERIVSSIIHQISSTQVHHVCKCQSGKAR